MRDESILSAIADLSDVLRRNEHASWTHVLDQLAMEYPRSPRATRSDIILLLADEGDFGAGLYLGSPAGNKPFFGGGGLLPRI